MKQPSRPMGPAVTIWMYRAKMFDVFIHLQPNWQEWRWNISWDHGISQNLMMETVETIMISSPLAYSQTNPCFSLNCTLKAWHPDVSGAQMTKHDNAWQSSNKYPTKQPVLSNEINISHMVICGHSMLHTSGIGVSHGFSLTWKPQLHWISHLRDPRTNRHRFVHRVPRIPCLIYGSSSLFPIQTTWVSGW